MLFASFMLTSAVLSDSSLLAQRQQQLFQLKQNITCQYYNEPLRAKECIGEHGVGTRIIRRIPIDGQMTYCSVMQEIEPCFTLQTVPPVSPNIDMLFGNSQDSIVTKKPLCEFQMSEDCGGLIPLIIRKLDGTNVERCSWTLYNFFEASINTIQQNITPESIENNDTRYNYVLYISSILIFVILLLMLNSICSKIPWSGLKTTLTILFKALASIVCCCFCCCRRCNNNNNTNSSTRHNDPYSQRTFRCCAPLCPKTWEILNVERSKLE